MSNSDETYRGSLKDTFSDFEATPAPRVWQGVEAEMGINEPKGGLMTTFEGFEQVPGLKVWSGIEATLAQDPPRRRRRVAGWYWAAAAAVAILVVSVVVFNTNGDQSEMNYANSGEDVVPATMPMFPQPPARPQYPGGHHLSGGDGGATEMLANNSANTQGGNSGAFGNDAQIPAGDESANNSNSDPRFAAIDATAANGSIDAAFAANENGMNSIPALKAEQIWYPEPLTVAIRRPFNPMAINPTLPQRDPASFRMATGFSPAGSSNNTDWSTRSTTADASLSSTAESSSGEQSYIPGYSRPTFSAPVVYALAVNLPLTKRLSLESGLSYTRIATNSSGIHQSTGYPRELKTNLHYIGLPLVTRLHVSGKNKFSIGSVQGIQVEKPLVAQYEQTTFVANKDGVTQEFKDGQSGIQASILAGLDAEYKIGKRIGLHIRPQAAMYVVQHKNAYNMFSHRRVWPSLQTGVRLHLD